LVVALVCAQALCAVSAWAAEPSSPAVDYSYTDPDAGVTVAIAAPEGAFPEGTTVAVRPVAPEEGGVLDAALASAQGVATGSQAARVSYDITFTCEGVEVQPADGHKVDVRFSAADGSALAGGKGLAAYHITNGTIGLNEQALAGAESVVAQPMAATESSSHSVTVTASSFSVYLVTNPAQSAASATGTNLTYGWTNLAGRSYLASPGDSFVLTNGSAVNLAQWRAQDYNQGDIPASYFTIVKNPADSTGKSVKVTVGADTPAGAYFIKDQYWRHGNDNIFYVKVLPKGTTITGTDPAGMDMYLFDYYGDNNNGSYVKDVTVGSTGINRNYNNDYGFYVSKTLDATGMPTFNKTGLSGSTLWDPSLLTTFGTDAGVQWAGKVSKLFTYDSASKRYSFSAANNAAAIDQATGQFKLYPSRTNKSYFPFNSPDDATGGSGSSVPSHNQVFGMYMKADFRMPENGTLDGTATGDPMQFTFTGDDDVYVYIDGKLVIDLGGAHGAQTGIIDFAKGTGTYYTMGPGDSGTPHTIDFSDIFSSDELRDGTYLGENQVHTFAMFYTDSGGWSNFSMSYNLMPVQYGKLTVKKDVSGVNPVYKDQDYSFQLLDASTGNPITGKYNYVIAGDATKTVRTTGANGTFTLKGGQTADFTGVKGYKYPLFAGANLKVKEITTGLPTGFDTPQSQVTGYSAQAKRSGDTTDSVEVRVSDANNVIFYNSAKGSLAIRKEFAGGTSTQAFPVVVTLTATVNGATKTYTQKGTIKAGTGYTVRGLLPGTTYAITENLSGISGFQFISMRGGTNTTVTQDATDPTKYTGSIIGNPAVSGGVLNANVWVTNRIVKDVTVTKTWAGSTNATTIPSDVTFTMAGGNLDGKTYTLHSPSWTGTEDATNLKATGTEKAWTYTFKDQPSYDSNKALISYAANETEIGGTALDDKGRLFVGGVDEQVATGYWQSSASGTALKNTFYKYQDNQADDVTFTVLKTDDSTPAQPLGGAEFTLTDDAVTGDAGTTKTTTTAGEANFTVTPGHTYTLKETSAPQYHHMGTTTTWTIKVKSATDGNPATITAEKAPSTIIDRVWQWITHIYSGDSAEALSDETLIVANPRDTYSVTYNENGGNKANLPEQVTGLHAGDSTTLANGAGMTKAAGTDASGRSCTYAFVGWGTTTDAQPEDVVDTASIDATTPDNVTVYAVWQAQYQETLKYDMNGGTGKIADDTFGPDPATSHVFSVSDTKPTRLGYDFLGWADKSTDATATYQAGDAVTVTGGTTKTIYAVWAKSTEGVTVTKVWQADAKTGELGPTAAVTVNVKNPDGTTAMSGIKLAGTDPTPWSKTFTAAELPKYSYDETTGDATQIDYTLTETAMGEGASALTQDVKGNWVVYGDDVVSGTTNTYNVLGCWKPSSIGITVTNTWIPAANSPFGEFEVHKVDGTVGRNGAALPGAKFTLARTSTGKPYSATLTTDKDGKATFTNLGPGTYSLTETAPAGFTGESVKSITVGDGGAKTLESVSEPDANGVYANVWEWNVDVSGGEGTTVTDDVLEVSNTRVNYTVAYSWTSGTPNKDLPTTDFETRPSSIENLTVGDTYTVDNNFTNGKTHEVTDDGTWTFSGWKVDGKGDVVTGDQTMPAANVSLEGVWTFTPYAYKVIYHENGGDAAGLPQPKTGLLSGASCTLDAGKSMTRAAGTDGTADDGAACTFKFLGWGAAADATTAMDPQQVTIAHDNVDVYAVWQPLYKPTLVYNANGGTGAPGKATYGPTADATHDFAVSGTQPTRKGYTFKGWADSEDAKTAAYTTVAAEGTTSTIPVAKSASKTVYAVWGASGETVPVTVTKTWANGTPTGVTITVKGSDGSSKDFELDGTETAADGTPTPWSKTEDLAKYAYDAKGNISEVTYTATETGIDGTTQDAAGRFVSYGDKTVADSDPVVTNVLGCWTSDGDDSNLSVTNTWMAAKDEYTELPGSLSIHKQDAAEDAMKGVTFTLASNDPDVAAKSASTDAKGNVTFAGLADGTYTLIETAPTGYAAAGPWTVTVSPAAHTKQVLLGVTGPAEGSNAYTNAWGVPAAVAAVAAGGTDEVEEGTLTVTNHLTHKVFYSWSSGTDNRELPTGTSFATLPADAGAYVNGQAYTVDTSFDSSSSVDTHDAYGNVDGRWTFSGWTDPNDGTMGDSDVTITGTWTWAAGKVDTHHVSYSWTSATTGKALPAGIGTVPTDDAPYVKGQSYTVDAKFADGTTALDKDAYGNVDGTWTFSGWTDPENGTMGDADVAITGTWAFVPIAVPTHKVTYSWGGDAPTGDFAQTVPGGTAGLVNNQPYQVDGKYTKGYVVKGTDAWGNVTGTWTFSGWTDPNAGTMGETDVTITGSWAYVAQEVPAHKVAYSWASATPGMDLPAGLGEPPTDAASYVKNQPYAVDASHAAGTTFDVRDTSGNVTGTWTFSGWSDPNKGVMGETDVTVTGMWTYAEAGAHEPHVTLAKSVDRANAQPGDTLTYTIVASNDGSAASAGYWVKDYVPANTTFVSCDATGTYGSTVDGKAFVSWFFESIAPGGSKTMTLTVKMNECEDGSQVQNVAMGTQTGASTPPEDVAGVDPPVASNVAGTVVNRGVSLPPATEFLAKTGDPANLVVLVGLLAAGVVATVAGLARRRQERR
jgi:uncharacterized repeat protein (TIGR01451 family)/fibro-slime domain-containing protein/uncharacterized repeat protein (TIGR02543 family)